MRILLDNAPADGNGNPTPTPPPPQSPTVVKRTAIKSPNEIALEKKLAVVEDKLAGLEGWKSEVDTFLEGIGAGAPVAAPVKVKPGKVNTPPALQPQQPSQPQPKRGILETIESDIWGNRES